MVSFLAGMSYLADLGKAKKRRGRVMSRRKAEAYFKQDHECDLGWHQVVTTEPGSECTEAAQTGSVPPYWCCAYYGGGTVTVVLPKRKLSPQEKKLVAALAAVKLQLVAMKKLAQKLRGPLGGPDLENIAEELRNRILALANTATVLEKPFDLRYVAARNTPDLLAQFSRLVAEGGYPLHKQTDMADITGFLISTVTPDLENTPNDELASEPWESWLTSVAGAASSVMKDYGEAVAEKLKADGTIQETASKGGRVTFKATTKDNDLRWAAAFSQMLVNQRPTGAMDFSKLDKVKDFTFVGIAQNPSAPPSGSGTAASRLVGLGQPAVPPEKPRKKTAAELAAIGAAAGVAVGMATKSKTAGVVAGIVCPMIMILIEKNAWEEYDAWVNRVYAAQQQPGTQA